MTSSRTRAALAVSVAGLVVGVGGCGLGQAVVGVHDAPAEHVTGAPVSQPSAERITRRVLAAAASARRAEGTDGTRQRAATMTGPALAAAAVAPKYRDAPGADRPVVTRPPDPSVLAVSRGQQWPRAILATTREGGVQRLHALVSTSATEPFRLFASVTMQPGASVPSLGEIADGAALVTDDTDLVLGPRRALVAYAKALRVPRPAEGGEHVATDDAFAAGLTASTKEEEKRLGRLATLRRRHEADPDSTIAFRLAGGGAVAFGQMTRTDTVTATDKAKELVLPRDLAHLVGKRKVSDHVAVVTLETLAMTIPATGKAHVIGVDEQRTAVRGR